MTINETRTEISRLTERANGRQLDLILRIVRLIIGEEAQV